MDTKILCFYLPQFHATEDNNKWWGEGYTDWNASRDARAFFKGHKQPRTPLGGRYYDLADETAEALNWQAQLAKRYGIYGFCIYHYWFAGKRELEKPVEILRNHKEIDIHYSLCWDSATWRRTWYAQKFEQEVLIQQEYGDREMWTKHFNDLLPDFLDERYIKIDNKPVFHIYNTSSIPCIEEMRNCWDELAKQQGFDGIYLVAGDIENRRDKRVWNAADAFYNFEPRHAFYTARNKWYGIYTVSRAGIIKRINAWFHKEMLPDRRQAKGIYDIIEKITAETGKRTYLGVFTDYDDTPRRQLSGAVYVNNNIAYFRKCLKTVMRKSMAYGNEFLYVNAWNEWGESAYLEPDEENGYLYLETLRQVVDEES
ncbi:MAG: glycoside hydrolase family 99-like domain-containing protein [Roseburia sp.]|nr:glycoside hydrolase family 99-like domain-containing protein [Roseburia sp.]